MLITIAAIVVATIALSALEVWLFWRLGERDDRRRSQSGSAERRWPEAGNDDARPRASRSGETLSTNGTTHVYG
ncbi:MAG: hypothetical protein ACTHMY_24915 [Solirubrobacteraceae bacterium]